MTTKAEKDRYYQGRILNSLLRHDIVTVSMLAEEAGIAENSVRSKLTRVEAFLKENQLGSLGRKAHVGIWLEASDAQRQELRSVVDASGSEQEFISDQKLRRDEVLRLIFQMKRSQPLTLAGIGSKLYLSPQAAKRSFQSAVEWLAKNGVQAQAVQNKGITLEAEEATYRRVLQNYLLQNYFDDLTKAIQDFLPGIPLLEIRQCLVEEESTWRLEFSDYSFREIWLYLCIAIYRMNGGHRIEHFDKDEEQEITKHKEFEFASGLTDMLSKKKSMEIPWAEILNLAKVILCSGLAYDMPGGRATDDIFEYDTKLRAFTKDVITTMSVVIGEDLTEDEHLYEGLLQHLRPAIFRLRYGYEKVDNLLDYTKQEYKNIYRAAWSTSTLFEEYFNVKVTEEELLYITLYVEVALERNNRPLSAALIVQNNDIHAQLIAMKLRKALPRIADLELVSLPSVSTRKLHDCDLVFTTVDNIETRFAPRAEEKRKLIHIPKVLTDSDIVSLKQKVRDLTDSEAKKEEKLALNSIQLLDPELMFIHSDLTDKADIIHMMVDRLVADGYVLPEYFDSVMDREAATTTAIGNGIAIPHGFSSGVIQSKVCICTLQTPIRWNDEMVDVIFLIASKTRTMAEANDMRQFYKYFVKLTDTNEKINILRGITSGSEMYKYLIS